MGYRHPYHPFSTPWKIQKYISKYHIGCGKHSNLDLDLPFRMPKPIVPLLQVSFFFSHPGPWVCHICKYTVYINIYIYHPSICWAVDKYIVLNINTCGAKVNSISIQTPAPKEHTSYAMSRSSWHWLNNEQSNMLCPRGGFKHVLVT